MRRRDAILRGCETCGCEHPFPRVLGTMQPAALDDQQTIRRLLERDPEDL